MSNNPLGRGRGGQFRGGQFRGGPPSNQPSQGPRGGGRGGQGGYRGGGRGGGPPGAGGSGDIIFGDPAPVDQRLSTSQQLVDTLKKIQYSPKRPTRPGFGTLGKSGFVRSNFFAVRFPKDGTIYDYRVDFSPTTDLRSIKARLFELLEGSSQAGWQEYVPYIAHDGSARLVSSKELPQPLNVAIPFRKEGQTQPDRRDKTYTISIVLTQKLEASELHDYTHGDRNSRNYDFAPIVGAYNLVLQNHASHTGVRVGKNRYFFASRAGEIQLSTGIVAWKGFFMSARPVYKELMVNVGVCMTAFYVPGNLADAMKKFQERSNGAMLQRFAQKLKVTTNHLGYKQTKTIKRITSASAKDTTFQCDELNAVVSVEQYFRQKYGKTLKSPHLPVVDISGPNAKHPILVPPELCEIPHGQRFRGKLNDNETTQMLRSACNPPAQNAHAIVGGLPLLGLTGGNQKLDNFDLTVSNNMTVIPFRELPPPNVSYRGGRPPSVINGSWNILEVKFHAGGAVKSWWILLVTEDHRVFQGPNDPALTKLWKGFATKCERSGMTGISAATSPVVTNVDLPAPSSDTGRQIALNRIRDHIQNLQKERGTPSFVLVILSRRDNYIYPGIKRICDVELGIHTVHVLSNKVLEEKRQDQYFSNVALKVNMKLGGTNHRLDDGSLKWLTKTRTMLVGMDVTHPGPGSIAGTPSIAAVVASVDSSFAQFPASMRCQKSKQEMIDHLCPMMVERLKKFQEVSKSLPERVIVFRDGVSEGQFDIVINNMDPPHPDAELPKILEAFQKLSPKGGKPYRPHLTIIICGKRHHVRNWPMTSGLADNKGNPRPGTVCDQGITSVFDFDFYLQAHAGLQGHAKPTHYTVVYDESKLGADEVQQGINTACYMYARATKAVSLVPPAYYADLACERGRCYLNNFLASDDNMTTTSKGRSKESKEEAEKKVYDAAVQAWGKGIHPNLAGSMFYI